MTGDPGGSATDLGAHAQNLGAHAQNLGAHALALARVFTAGGRLVVTAPGRQDHARHVAVEFIHPAITGARALPAMAVDTGDLVTAVGENDAVLIIEDPTPGQSKPLEAPPAALTIRVGGAESPLAGSDLVRWYHLLWELVQLGLEHPGITGGNASAGGDSTSFLYPFLDASESDDQALLSALITSAGAKSAESHRLAERSLDQNRQAIDNAAADIAARHQSGGTVFAIGNGGSACDAARLVRLLKTRGIRAAGFAEDPAVITALANDLGANMIFSRQAEAGLGARDVLVAFSTSGSSKNLLAALDVPTAATASVIAIAGYDGGPLCQHRNVDHRLIVDSSSVHRIQETQARLIDELCLTLNTATPKNVTPKNVTPKDEVTL
ncbi:MAG: D-sedoheptulose-7-phosphate isomerase [Acidimicrobiales bacterium]